MSRRISIGFGNETKDDDPIDDDLTTSGKKEKRRTTECVTLSNRYLYRRAFSETQLLDVLPREFKDGESYHCITAGDVDSLSYLKVVLRQQNLEHCLFSTWCMAAEDVLQIEEWVEAGRIKKLDAYVGEIFPNQYRIEYSMLKAMFKKYDCGRIAIFKNHSKIYAGYGDKFYFGIETSANINTNPRTENGCITIDKGLYDFYRAYFDGIKSFEKG
ncbi:MAG: hypothetical protein LBQ73_07525 [Tannerellaceae bacterium]|jgi:hypothetical protein|nr:hypothetical protein [Tannerellaceae bacterium]